MRPLEGLFDRTIRLAEINATPNSGEAIIIAHGAGEVSFGLALLYLLLVIAQLLVETRFGLFVALIHHWTVVRQRPGAGALPVPIPSH